MDTLTSKKAVWTQTNSQWKIVTGTQSGISGQHPNMLSIDEIEFMDTDALEQSWAVPVNKNGHKRLWTGFSTRQRSYGVMNMLTADIEAGRRNLKLFQWSVFETMRRCESCVCIKGGQTVSDPDSACALWKYCHGKKGIKSSGWMPRDEIINLMGTMSQESVETQLLCLRPSTHGLVLPNFRHESAVIPNGLNFGNYAEWTYTKELPLILWHDPAEGNKTVLLFAQYYKGRIFVFDEYIDDNCFTVGSVKIALEDILKKKGYNKPKYVVVDPHRRDAGKEWENGAESGIGVGHSYQVEFPSFEGPNNVYEEIEPGLELLRTMICNGNGVRSIYVNPHQCPKLVTALKNNNYTTEKGNILTQKSRQAAKYKDEVDTMRYGVIHAVQNYLRHESHGVSM
jgi:hypothetical protein